MWFKAWSRAGTIAMSKSHSSLKSFFRPALDLKIWGLNSSTCNDLITCHIIASIAHNYHRCMCTVIYAIAFFMPTILLQPLKFTLVEVQALSTPPYVFACLQMSTEGWLGDKSQLQSPIIIYNAIQAMVGI